MDDPYRAQIDTTDLEPAQRRPAGVREKIGQTADKLGQGAESYGQQLDEKGRKVASTGRVMRTAGKIMIETGIGSETGAPLYAVGEGAAVGGEEMSRGGKALARVGQGLKTVGKWGNQTPKVGASEIGQPPANNQAPSVADQIKEAGKKPDKRPRFNPVRPRGPKSKKVNKRPKRAGHPGKNTLGEAQAGDSPLYAGVKRRIIEQARRLAEKLNEEIAKGNDKIAYIIALSLALLKDFLDVVLAFLLIGEVPEVNLLVGLFLTSFLFFFMLKKGWFLKWRLRFWYWVLGLFVDGLPVFGVLPINSLLVLYAWKLTRKRARKAKVKLENLANLTEREVNKLNEDISLLESEYD